MRKKLLLTLLVGFFALLPVAKANAAVGDIIDVDNVKYKILSESERTVAITGLRNEGAFTGTLTLHGTVIKDNVEYKTVKIGSEAFRNKAITSAVAVPSGVTVIESSAFRGTGLTSVTLPNGLTTIEDDVFQGAALSQVTIPDSVTMIGRRAFVGNSLTSVVLPENLNELKYMAFADNVNLASVTIPNSVSSIWGDTFTNVAATGTFYIAGGMTTEFGTTLANLALPPAGWATVDLATNSIAVKTSPATTNYYAEDNFDPTGLVITATLNNGNNKDVAYNDATKNSFTFSKTALALGDDKVAITYDGKSVDLPITVNGFKVNGIKYNILTDTTVEVAKQGTYTGAADIPASVTYGDKTYDVVAIGEDAFELTGLTSVTIPDSVKTIKKGAFGGAGLTSVTIPSSVTFIGDGALAHNAQLVSITVPNTVETIKDYAFFNLPANGTVYVAGGTNDAFNAKIMGGNLPDTWTIASLVISDLVVKTSPKVTYIAGENFDPTGLILTATYINGEVKDVEYNDTTVADFVFSKTKLAITDDKIVITYGGKSVDLPITVAARVYDFVSGGKQTYVQNEDNVAVFVVDVDYGLFENGGKVYVDGVLLSVDNYTSEAGSVIIRLAKAYMDTLDEGRHTMKVVFNDGGTATTTFMIKKKAEAEAEVAKVADDAEETSNPDTGDVVVSYVAIFGLSVIGLTAVGIYAKKEV